MRDVDPSAYVKKTAIDGSASKPAAGKQEDLERDQLIRQSRQLALEQAALVGAAGCARPHQKGENLDTSQLAEADEWVGVYSELAHFSRELLAEMVRQDADSPGVPRADALRTRLALEIQVQLHELHLCYWQRRREQLRAACDQT